MADNEKPADDIIQSMEGMERIVADEYQEQDDFEDDTGLTRSAAEIVRSRYWKEGSPDWNAHYVTPPPTIGYYDTHGHEVENDYYLKWARPDEELAGVYNKSANEVRDYESQSAYNRGKGSWSEAAKLNMPQLAANEGSKGVSSVS